MDSGSACRSLLKGEARRTRGSHHARRRWCLWLRRMLRNLELLQSLALQSHSMSPSTRCNWLMIRISRVQAVAPTVVSPPDLFLVHNVFPARVHSGRPRLLGSHRRHPFLPPRAVWWVEPSRRRSPLQACLPLTKRTPLSIANSLQPLEEWLRRQAPFKCKGRRFSRIRIGSFLTGTS